MELAAKQHPREVNFDEPSLELAPMKGQMGSGACGKKEALEKYQKAEDSSAAHGQRSRETANIKCAAKSSNISRVNEHQKETLE